jgi:hypothetical protein
MPAHLNPDTGNYVVYTGGGEYGMDWQMDDDYRMQSELDSEREDIINDTAAPRMARVMTAILLAADRKRRANNIASEVWTITTEEG